MSVSLCLSVCLSACLLAYLKNEMSKVPNFTEILCMSPTAVVRSFFSRVAIRYVLPVFLRMAPCLHLIVQATQAKRLLE